jgi:hypothetical protein
VSPVRLCVRISAQRALLASLFPLSGKFHGLAPARGLRDEHIAEPAGVSGDGNRAKLGKSLLDQGVVKRSIDFFVEEIDDGRRCAMRGADAVERAGFETAQRVCDRRHRAASPSAPSW